MKFLTLLQSVIIAYLAYDLAGPVTTIELTRADFDRVGEDLKCLSESADPMEIKYAGFVFHINLK
jgi:hypothetical protein